jgi:archaellum component FlaF (FlaF/FlaG flagellin family)
MTYFVLLLNLLIAMFSNTYQRIYENKNAIRLKRILDMKNRLTYDPMIGSVTSTFFPINILMIPFMIPVIIVQNKKLNEMINKLQYAALIFFQAFVILILQFILFPIMYVKMVLNSINIMIISKNQGIERYLEPFFSVIASPFIIFISILVDVASMPTVLLQPEEEFEEKYQRNVDELNEDQVKKVNWVFKTILYTFWTKYQGKNVSYFELMSMHRQKFGIMENLNDLLCKGSKDYKESLATVQDFNCTKIMTRICSVPSKNGDIT